MLALPPEHIVSLVLASDARLRRALADAEAARPPDPLALAAALNALGLLCKDLARYQEASGYYRRALGLLEGSDELHAEEIATLYHNLGGIEHARAEYAAGEAFARRGLAIRAAIPGSDPCALAEAKQRKRSLVRALA